MAAKRKSKKATKARQKNAPTSDRGAAYAVSATSNGNAQQPERAPPTQPPGGGNGNGEATPDPGNGAGHAHSDHHLPRPRSREEITAEETAGHLALRILAAKISEQVLSSMSALFDELIQEKSHLLDDDDEEQDEGWIDTRRERER